VTSLLSLPAAKGEPGKEAGSDACASTQATDDAARRSLAAVGDKLRWGAGVNATPAAAVGAGDSTLGLRIERLWEGLWAGGHPACPLCGGVLRLRDGAGRCEACGSALS